MIEILKNNRWLWIILAIFIFSRFFGLGQLYHQDEYRWVQQVYTEEFGVVDSPHPPVMQILFSWGGQLFGYDNLRIVPLIFAVLNLLLIYAVSLKITGIKKIAYIASIFYTVNVYSLIASTMVDIDGTFLPFLALLAYYFYLLILDGNKKFILPLLLVVLVGFFTKLSYILFVGALTVEFLWRLYDQGKFKKEMKRVGLILGSVILFAVGFFVLYGKIDPRFAEYSSGFRFLDFSSRSYFELSLRFFKFFIWLSPLLFLPVIYGLFKKEIFTKNRIWYVYTLFNVLFYVIIFDFTRLPIERYFMFMIIPAVLISAEVIGNFLSRLNKTNLAIGTLAFLAILVVTIFVAHEVVPLNPKEAYVEKVKNLDFNFFIPLTGGSGPIGFYGSAQFILWTWVLCAVGILMVKKRWGMPLLIVIGLGYNIFLSVENLSGVAYGSVDKITKQSLDYVIDNPEIDRVITYYDAGVYYLLLADKYEARFYTAPSRDYTERINRYRGYYMIVDFPAIDKNAQYWKLISRCRQDKKFTDKYVESYIFDCRLLPKN